MDAGTVQPAEGRLGCRGRRGGGGGGGNAVVPASQPAASARRDRRRATGAPEGAHQRSGAVGICVAVSLAGVAETASAPVNICASQGGIDAVEGDERRSRCHQSEGVGASSASFHVVPRCNFYFLFDAKSVCLMLCRFLGVRRNRDHLGTKAIDQIITKFPSCFNIFI